MSNRPPQPQIGSQTNIGIPDVLSDSSGLYSSQNIENNIPARFQFRNSPTVSPIVGGVNNTLSSSSTNSSSGSSTQGSEDEDNGSFQSSPQSPYTSINRQTSTTTGIDKSQEYLSSIRSSLHDISSSAGIPPSSPLSLQHKIAARQQLQQTPPPKPLKNVGKKSAAKSLMRTNITDNSDDSDYENSREQEQEETEESDETAETEESEPEESEPEESEEEEESEPTPRKPTPESSGRAIKKSAANKPLTTTHKKAAASIKQTTPPKTVIKKAVVKKSATPAKVTPIKKSTITTPNKGRTTFGVPKSPLRTPGGTLKTKKRRDNVRVEIRKFRRSVEFLIPKLPFSRFVKEIVHQSNTSYRMTAEAVIALHTVSESMISRLFEDSNICAGHAKRVTIGPRDVRLVRQLRVYL